MYLCVDEHQCFKSKVTSLAVLAGKLYKISQCIRTEVNVCPRTDPDFPHPTVIKDPRGTLYEYVFLGMEEFDGSLIFRPQVSGSSNRGSHVTSYHKQTG